MQTRLFSLGIGIIYLLVGVAAFVPALYTSVPSDAPTLHMTTSYGYFLGLFPVNALHDVVHILIGLAGILASARIASARYYSQTLFLAYGLLTVMGFLPQLDTVFGYIPIFSSDTWLHAGTAIVASYFGWVAHEDTNVEPAPAHGTSH
ncbi:MAG: hypothetical protein NVSMB52_08190 [Chloroflexota bacterium]